MGRVGKPAPIGPTCRLFRIVPIDGRTLPVVYGFSTALMGI